jgi:HD-like signal output (HDOD) protein
VYEDDVPLLEAEKKVLGTTHAQVGGWLAEKWNLPPSITESILLHHEPMLAKKNKEIVLLTNFADFLVRHAKIGDSGNKADPVIDPAVAEKIQELGISINDESLEKMRMDLILELDKAEAFISILQSG